MLDGFWMLDVNDSSGLRAAGLVLLRDGMVIGDGAVVEVDGRYEWHSHMIIADLEILLRGKAPGVR